MDPSVVILTEQEIRESTDLTPALVDAVEDGFRIIATGGASTPSPMFFDVDAGNEIDVKAVWIRPWGDISIKVATGFFQNPAKGLPSGNSVMLSLDATTGMTRAVLLEGGYLTTLRAAAAGAIAARWLAPTSAATVGIIGTGELARWHAKALLLRETTKCVLVYGRSADRAGALVRDLSESSHVRATRAQSVQELVEASDIVVTCTSAHDMLVRSAWVHPGMHITAAGADVAGKQELDPEILHRADRVVCDSRTQVLTQGECQHVVNANPGMAQDLSWLTELGDIVAGKVPGRVRDDEVTVCDLTGVGMQDAAIARYVLANARRAADPVPVRLGD